MVCLLYALGLLAKPMLVTLPLVLLLLDYWPLRRGQVLWRLVIEKIPLLLLSLADSALTIHTQVNAIQSLETVSWPARGANVVAAYVSYLGCLFWPQGLAVLYPHPRGNFSTGRVWAAIALLAAILVALIVLRRRAPYLLVGWLWYLGMLLPVIGLLQVGGQSMADRYTYLPQIGLVLGLVWAVADTTGFLGSRGGVVGLWASRILVALAAAGIVAALAVAAWRQTAYWQNSETLWVRDLMYPNLTGRYNLGLALDKEGRHLEAIEQYRAALAIDRDDQDTHNALGLAYESLGRLDDAAGEFRTVLAAIQGEVDADNKRAEELRLQGRPRESAQQAEAAVEKQKEADDAKKSLARVMHRQD